MATDDIYGNKAKFERFLANIDKLDKPAEDIGQRGYKRQYYCRNPANLGYFKDLSLRFEARDISFVRRLRVFSTLLLITFATDKDLKNCSREDIDMIMAFSHQKYKTIESKKDFVKNIKWIWRQLFPERDPQGRVDDSIMPYPVRHLSGKIDRSKEVRGRDRLTLEEYEKLVSFFTDEPRMQAYLTLSFESLARPQELLFTKIKDYYFYDNYCKVYISSHGKMGTGLLQCIDSFPFVSKWFNAHPYKSNPESFFFCNQGDSDMTGQMRPENINKKLRNACGLLKINKPISCYSLKRNGVTFSRLRGDSDVEIQHRARWTSTKQLNRYDKSSQEDAMRLTLIKKGLVNDVTEAEKKFLPEIKVCIFCNTRVAFNDEVCPTCKHFVSRDKIKGQIQENDSMKADIQALKEGLGQVLKIIHSDLEKRHELEVKLGIASN